MTRIRTLQGYQKATTKYNVVLFGGGYFSFSTPINLKVHVKKLNRKMGFFFKNKNLVIVTY